MVAFTNGAKVKPSHGSEEPRHNEDAHVAFRRGQKMLAAAKQSLKDALDAHQQGSRVSHSAGGASTAGAAHVSASVGLFTVLLGACSVVLMM